MKITQVKQVNGRTDLFVVTFKPNRFEKFFGCKRKLHIYKDTGYKYVFGGGSIYENSKGFETRNGSAINCAIDQYKKGIK
jgi:hypothetical protein